MTALQDILAVYRKEVQKQRQKGTFFEELIRTYLPSEATYADLYSDVWCYCDWEQYQPKAGSVPAPNRAKNDYSGDTTCHD